MRLKLQRFSDNGESTLGLLYINNKFECYTLENPFKKVKVEGNTRIDAALYEITLRIEGKLHQRYETKFPEFHRGMLWLRDVTSFLYVLFHIGNSSKDTDGCILLGDSANNNSFKDGFISNSGDAYKRLYPLIAASLLIEQQVFVEIIDEPYRTS